jgi:hypothetical protein
MRRFVQDSRWGLAKPLALAVALLSLIFLLQVTTHGHANGQDEGACRLCQAGHVSAAPVVSGIILTAPLVPVGEVAARHFDVVTESSLSHSDPRGPPAEVLS